MISKNNSLIKTILFSIIVLGIGIFIGYEIGNGKIASIQGYLFNAASEATNSNASDCNASDANASDANASDANASDANASDANASDANASDANCDSLNYILELDNFEILNSKANYITARLKLQFVTRIPTIFEQKMGIFKNQGFTRAAGIFTKISRNTRTMFFLRFSESPFFFYVVVIQCN